MSIDEKIRSAGARLASTSVAVPNVERLVRRRSRRAKVAAVASTTIVISIGIATLNSHRSNEQSVTADGVAVDASARPYELLLDGATPLPVESLTATGTHNTVWIDEATNTYVTLVVRPGLALNSQAPSGPFYMVEDASFPAAEGRAWFTSTSDTVVRHLKMWWSRPDGDVWLLDSFWYGQDPMNTPDGRRTLREWALAITAPEQFDTQQQYRLDDPSMRNLATDPGGDVESRAYVWNYRTGTVLNKITLLSLQDAVASGRASLLAWGKPKEVLIDGHDGWQVTDSTTGDTFIGWQTDDARPLWLTLTIPANLASLTPQIRAALQSR